MGGLLTRFTVCLIGLTVTGLMLNAVVQAASGISALGGAVVVASHLFATIWAGAQYGRRTLTVPVPGFLWRAAIAMTAILCAQWALFAALAVAPAAVLGDIVVGVMQGAPWVFAAALTLLAVLAVLGTRYALASSIRSVVDEEDRKIRETF